MIVKDLVTNEEKLFETIEEVKEYFASIGLDIDINESDFEDCEVIEGDEVQIEED